MNSNNRAAESGLPACVATAMRFAVLGLDFLVAIRVPPQIFLDAQGVLTIRAIAEQPVDPGVRANAKHPAVRGNSPQPA